MLAVLALDLGVFHRKAHAVGFKEALSWTGVWVTLAVLFGAGVWFWAGPQKGLEFFTGYLIEYSLSADNVFVFVLIFSYFAVPTPWQHKVLFWGVLGALVMRLVMIGLGVALIRQFGWILYVFGAFLLFTGFKMVFGKSEEIHPERNPVVRWFRKLAPVTSGYHGDRFVARVDGRRAATPLLVVLVCIEVSDLVFAVDSIPAIFAVTLDPFIVYTSNVFAILGLRSLYFVLAGMVNKFHYLKTGLGVVLPLPIPLSNTLPALTVVLLAAGAMERDGLFFVAGCVSFVVAVAYIGALTFGGAHVVDELRHAWFGA